MAYGGIALCIRVQSLFRAESSVHLPTSDLVVPILVATKEIYHGTYVVSHVMDHNGPQSLQASEVLPLSVDPFCCTKSFEGIV